jgi:hypothetical protein
MQIRRLESGRETGREAQHIERPDRVCIKSFEHTLANGQVMPLNPAHSSRASARMRGKSQSTYCVSAGGHARSIPKSGFPR